MKTYLNKLVVNIAPPTPIPRTSSCALKNVPATTDGSAIVKNENANNIPKNEQEYIIIKDLFSLRIFISVNFLVSSSTCSSLRVKLFSDGKKRRAVIAIAGIAGSFE